jgi:DNA topoisomerase III
MKLVVAEKPSVARDLARVLGVHKKGKGSLVSPDWVITWCIGHLVELEEPQAYDPSWKRWSFTTLPMLPSPFKLRPAKRTTEQWRIVRDLLRRKDFTSVVNACDAGREGELIFRYVHERAKSTLPIERLWISSLTTSAIEEGLASLRPGRDFEGLAAAARCRSQADWLVGMNATRAMTLISPRGSVYSIGRVQTPTLALLVDREKAITGFEPQPFWELSAKIATEPQGSFVAKWRALTGHCRVAEATLAKQRHDRAAAALVRDGGLHVAEVSEKETRERPPQLFDLTSLQRLANQRFGLSAKRTLEGLQKLYERHKAITYPRTSSRYLSQDQRPTLAPLVKRFSGHPSYGAHADRLTRGGLGITRRIVDDAKVTDHHAIIPTGKVPNLSGDEAKLFDLVVRRFLAALHPDARFQSTHIVLRSAPGKAPRIARLSDEILTALPDAPDHFIARGRVVTDAGWQQVEPPRQRGEQTMPKLQVGARVDATLVTSEGTTKPPPRYTDASLLGAMETAGKLVDDEQLREAMKACGLGTPATRAATIETLINRDYATRSSKTINVTPKGIELIDKLPVPTLRSAELTGAWEARLQEVAANKLAPAIFMADVHELVSESVATLRGRERPATPTRRLGVCPRCRADVREQRAGFACTACHFLISGRIASRTISAEEAELLLSRGRTAMLSGFRSKKKRRFKACLVLEDGEVTFSFPGKGTRTPKRPPASSEHLDALTCPGCSRTGLVAGKRAWGCAGWRDGCKFIVPFVIDGKKLTVTELRDLLTKGKTRKAAFSSGKGRLHVEGAQVVLKHE